MVTFALNSQIYASCTNIKSTNIQKNIFLKLSQIKHMKNVLMQGAYIVHMYSSIAATLVVYRNQHMPHACICSG